MRKYAIILILIFCLVSDSLSEPWNSHFKRFRVLLGYEKISCTESYFLRENVIPDRRAGITLKSAGLSFGYYFPGFELTDNLSIGLSPNFNVIGGAFGLSYNDIYETNGNSFSIAGIRFSPSIDLKYGGDATFNRESSKLGFGIGAGYFYTFLWKYFPTDQYGFALKTEAVYMFKKFLGIAINGYFPFNNFIHNKYTYSSYSVTLGIVGSFLFVEHERPRRKKR